MRSLPLVLFILILISCNRNLVKLEYTNAKNEVPQMGNLVFRFDRALAPDSLLNVWDSAAYIKFSPAIRGRFRWDQPDQLVFSPSQPLPPSTTFNASLTDEIIASSSAGNLRDEEILFFTAPLELQDLSVSWLVTDGSNVPMPRLDLYFNYAVSPAALENKIQVEVEGKTVQADLITLSDDSRISFTLKNVQAGQTDLHGKVTVGAGIIPKGGTDPTKEIISGEYLVPSPFNLVINDVSAQHDGIAGSVTVSTSQQLASADIISLIDISPAVKFSVEKTDEGFQLRSEQFDADKSYTLTLKKGLRGTAGGVLHDEYSNNIAFGELEPSISFATNKSVYLSAGGNRMIEARIVNVPRVRVIISKIYENNLLSAQYHGYEPRSNSDEEWEDEYSYNKYVPGAGDVIYDQVLETAAMPKLGNSRLFRFNIEDKLTEFKGIYHIRIGSVQNYWVSDSRFVSVSDLGLIAREGKDKLYVFTNSIKTTGAVEGVNILAYGKNNQVLGMASTNKDGVAEIAFTRKEFAGFRPALIVAKTENDFTYMPLSSTGVNISRFEVGGKRVNSAALDAFIYAERDIYRPGEKLNFSVVLRDLAWKSPGQLPVKFRLLYPNGKEFRVIRKTLNEQGSAEGQVDIPVSAITGTYVLEVYSSNDVLLGTNNFNIEEFVPDRIRVSSQLDKTTLAAGEKTTLNVSAMNFFGPPAAGRNYEVEIQLKSKEFAPKKYANYIFSIKNKGVQMDSEVKEGKLDEQGKAQLFYTVPALFANNGLLQADFFTTVFDETGRPVSRVASAPVYTQQVFFGIGDDGYWYHALNQPVRFPLIALDRSEKILNGVSAEVQVIKREYKTILAKAGEYFRYESQESERIIVRQTVTVGGESTQYQFVPHTPGNYEIRVSVPGSAGYVSRTFYSYGAWSESSNSFEVNTDGNIDIETDKSVYEPGEKAKILFKTPFNGRMLVTFEQDKVLSYQYVNVANRNASIDVPVTIAHLPNAFITATLIKSHGISEIPLTVAHGFQNMRVEERRRLNKVEIVAAKSTRSNTDQTITVKAEPGSFVTLAAVDNGVLQVSDFKTPDPYKFFYANRALQVDPFDMYPMLFPELRARLSSTGGDVGLEMQKRTNPMPAKRIQLVSYWSGITKTNGDGKAKINFHIPRFSGQVRLMAVAYRNESFGSAESVITVADPLVVSTGLPRFLTPGDSVDIPVTITNTLSKPVQATATIRTAGPLSVQGGNSKQLSLASNAESQVRFVAVANNASDSAKFIVQVDAAGEKFTETIPVSVRPAAPLLKQTATGVVTGGSVVKPALTATAFIPGTAKYAITLSKNPAAELARELSYVIRYPYGCTEQVVSGAFPQLYYGDIAGLTGNSRANSAAANVLEAIRTIQLRQLYNGAVTLWEGEGEENWWTTIYTAHFLLEAKKAGYEVDESLLSTMLNYINTRLRNKSTITYYYNKKQVKKIAPKEVAYGLYVLSLAARPNVSAMNYYKANPAVLSIDSKYLLGASYALMGDRKKMAEVVPARFDGEISEPQTGGSFYSPLRDEAIALHSLVETDPDNKQIPVMAKHVATELRNRQWYSTQECVFGLLALGKLARTASSGNVSGELRQNGKVVGRLTDKDSRFTFKGDIGGLEIRAAGSGRLYYFLEGEGVGATNEYREEDSYIKVRRRFFDRTGREIHENNFRQNDLVIVQVSVQKMYDGAVDNVVVTDMLPAGFEIENPRTKEIPGMDWIQNASTPKHLDVRDDRINLFIDLNENTQLYYYAVRAVSPGIFKMGPVAADAMYNAEYHSYHGAGTIKIND